MGPRSGQAIRARAAPSHRLFPCQGTRQGGRSRGVTGLGPAVRVVPPVSPVVAALQVAVEAVSATVPAELDQAQALADTETLLQIGQQLRVH